MLPIHCGQLILEPCLRLPGRAVQPGDFLLEGGDEGGYQLRRQQPLFQPGEDTCLHDLPGDRDTVVAGSFGAISGATVAILGHHGIARTTAAALQQPAEQELAPMRAVERVAGVVLAHLGAYARLAGFDPLPELV